MTPVNRYTEPGPATPDEVGYCDLVLVAGRWLEVDGKDAGCGRGCVAVVHLADNGRDVGPPVHLRAGDLLLSRRFVPPVPAGHVVSRDPVGAAMLAEVPGPPASVCPHCGRFVWRALVDVAGQWRQSWVGADGLPHRIRGAS